MATQVISIEQVDGRWNESSGAYMGEGKSHKSLLVHSNCDQDDGQFVLEFRFTFFALFSFEDAGPERASASEMDEQRKQQMAYQYLCHLEEAKV